MKFTPFQHLRFALMIGWFAAAPAWTGAQEADLPPVAPEVTNETNTEADVVPAVEATTPPADPGPMPSLEHLAADALVKAALARLRVEAEPTVQDYRVVALALRIAQRIRNNDDDLLRLEVQAWLSAGDEEQILKTTARLVRMDPKDTVATLRLLAARIQRLQNADDRLVAYDRLLGEGGSALDPSIRSRLALDAALLTRETGDEKSFIRRLTESVTLDSTNKDAAALYCTYFLDRTADVRERADLLGNVILADPNDMQAHTNLARELFRRGAYVAARRFLARAGDIAKSGGVEPTVNDLFDRFLLLWMTEGDTTVINAIEGLRRQSLAAIRAYRSQLESKGIDPGEEPEPLVPSEIEIVRLAVAWSLGDQEAMTSSARRIRLRLDEQLAALTRRDAPFTNVGEEEEQYYRDEAKLQRLSARLWAGIELDEAEDELNSLILGERGSRIGPYAQFRLRGLLAMRKGNLDLAEQTLRRAGDDPAARLGLGILAEIRGEQSAAIRAYASLAVDHAHRLIGCAAKKRIEAILGAPLAPTPDVRSLEEWSKAFAPWLDEMTADPSSFMSLTARHVRTRINVFDREELVITLRNVSRLPMSVGPDLAFNSRFLLSPRLIVKGEDISQFADPEALDLDRRLRLMPGESIEAVVCPSRGMLGVWLDRFADKTATVRWRVIQGYRLDYMRRFAPGLISVTAHSDMIQRDAVAPRADYNAVAESIATSQGREFLEDVLRLIGLAGTQLREETDEFQARKRRALADALVARMPTVSSLERAWIISVTTRVQLFNEAPALLDSSRSDPHPFVQAALLVDAYRDADDPMLIRLTEDPDPDLRAMAIAARERGRGGDSAPVVPPVWHEPESPAPPETAPEEPAEAPKQ